MFFFLQMTSGGTESIIMACKAYRDYAKETRGVNRPEIVLPRTAHAAFDKAGSYLGMRLKHIDVDYHTQTVNISAMKKAIGRNTVMVNIQIHFVYPWAKKVSAN